MKLKYISLVLAVVMLLSLFPVVTASAAAKSAPVAVMSDSVDPTEATEPTTEAIEETTDATVETTEAPTEEPTETSTVDPTDNSTEAPTEASTEDPTEAPTEEPSEAPTEEPEITPEPVSNIRAGLFTTTSFTLKWDKSANATEYKIFRSVEDKSEAMPEYSEYKSVTENYINESGLKQASRYAYTVIAIRKTDSYETKSSPVSVTVMTKPEAVKNFKVAEKTTTTFKLTWKKNTAASNYLIYRSAEKKNGSFPKFSEIKKLAGSKQTFTDKKLTPGRIYKYKIVAVRSKGSLLTKSEKPGVKAMTKLAAPKKIVEKDATYSSIKIAWSKVKFADKYEIYRDKKLIKTVKTTQYTDKKLKDGTKYKYSVRAIRRYNKKNFSGEFARLVCETNVRVYSVAKGLKGTWVEISIAKQTLNLFVDSKFYLSTPVVTGTGYSGPLVTSKGYHKVLSKSSPARLAGSYGGSTWDVTVNYWLGFTGNGQGIHDSTWRSSYGGTIYVYNGSHGCVNTPLGAMATIYSKAYIGMPVIVY